MADAKPDPGPEDPLSLDLPGLVDAYGGRLLRSAYLLCGARAEAEDLVQETFLQAFKSLSRFRGDSAAYTWLHGILLNLWRHRRRRQRRLVFDEDLIRKEAAPPVAGDEMDRNLVATRILGALQTLSREHREVIVLRYYEGLKIAEIARQTGTSSGTVKSRLHYAAQALQRLLPREMNLFVPEGTYDQTAP